jgi:hypothetical protein
MKEKTYRVFCGHQNCHETGFYGYNNRKELVDLDNRYGNGKWRCVRHTKPDEVLTIENKKRQVDVVAGKSKTYPELNNLYWNDGSGFIYGTGYKAYANDFPEGTILRITAEIILPNERKN